MTFTRTALLSLTLSTALSTISYAGPPKINLMTYDGLTLDQSLSTGVDFKKEPNLRDENEKTSLRISPKTNAPVELVFAFDQIVSPDRLRLKVSGAKKDSAKIEILVSTVSATAGFTSLRTEPIRDTDNWQSIDFEQAAAQWIIIKVIPFDTSASLSITEIDIQGHVGTPVTVYEFNESPANALELLSSLEGTIDLGITDDEASLFKDASDGTLDDWSFAEASLLSSGITDPDQRAGMLAKIDAMETQMRKSVPQSGDVFATGRALLEWLHKNPMTKGYIEGQTDVSDILTSKTYNCVSSATLYNILARRMGLDARGIEVPDHAFSILYDGTNHADVETTTAGGFNPARNKAGLTEFARKTGFVYINDKNRAKRREIDDAGMVALTYYNHGVGYSEAGEYQKALLNYFRALSLDPDNKSSVKNALSVLSNWSVDLIKQDKIDDAIKILDMGLGLAPKDRTLRHNLSVVWQNKIDGDLKSGNTDLALAGLRTAYEKTEDKSFLRLQAWVFQSQIQKHMETDEWETALTIAQDGLARVDKAALRDLERSRDNIILQWSSNQMDAQNWGKAMDILERGLALDDTSYKIKNNLGYVGQEWVRSVTKSDSPEAGQKLAIALSERFPKIRHLQRIASQSFDTDAATARDAGDYETATNLYAQALEQRPDDRRLRKNATATWDMWARTFMDAKDWAGTVDIYERAIAADPKASLFKRNLTFVAQEWSRELAAKDGAVAGEAILATLSDRFPDLREITRMRGQLVGAEISELVQAGNYETAALGLPDAKPYFESQSEYDNLVLRIYGTWADGPSQKGDWQAAIDIYAKGHEMHPENSSIQRNLVATWHQWAKIHMDKNEWQAAIDVYERGLASLPGTSLFTQNIRYCKSKL